jgi:hypothetical protein
VSFASRSVPSTIYFVECTVTSRIKIGCAGNVAARMRQLQAASPTELRLLATVPGGIVAERAVHDDFGDERLHGEWFAGSPQLRAFVDGVAQGASIARAA